MTDLKLQKSYSVCQPKDESVLPVPISDWNRLKKKIGGICPHRRIYQIWSSVFFGIFGSSILALIPFYNASTGLKPWVIPTTWAFLIGSLVLAISLLLLDSQQKKVIEQSANGVIEDMDALAEKHKIE